MLTSHRPMCLVLRVGLGIAIMTGATGWLIPPQALAASSYQTVQGSTILPSAPQQILPLGTITPQDRSSPSGRIIASFRPPPPHLRIPPRVVTNGPVVQIGTMQTPTVSNPGYEGFTGLTARDDGESLPALAGYGSSGEPPDQALCTGSGYVMEANNTVLAIYSAGSSHDLLGGPTNLAAFYGAANTNGLNLSDPRCLYDVPSGKWIVTLLVYASGAAPDCTPSTVGCKSFVYIAVSQTSDPRGAYNISKLDISDDGHANKPQCPCLGDQPYLGADANSVWITVNEFGPFSSFTTSYGAELYAIPKSQLLANPLGAIVVFPYSTASSSGADNDDSVQPAMVSGSTYDTSNGGTEYLMEAYASGTLRVFAATQTSRLSAGTPSAPLLTKKDIASQPFTTPPPMQQRTGAAPYQRTQSPATTDGGDARLLQLTYAAGKLWSSNATGATSGAAQLVASNYYVVSPGSAPGVFSPSVVRQGTVSLAGENLSYPAVGVNDAGQAEMVMSIVGPNNASGYAPYPSAGYVHLDATNGASSTIHIVNTGAQPADGFTGLPASQGPPERWGDYSAAHAATDGSIWFATEMIAGGPRVADTDWSTTVGHITDPSALSSQTVLAPHTQAQASSGQVGQPNSTTTSCLLPPSNQSLCHPEQSAIAPLTGNLWVADHADNRVLMFPDIGGAILPVATVVLGQPDFASYLCNQGAAPTAATLCNPRGVAVDGAGNVWVSDTGNNRVLKYAVPASGSDQPASSVLGQSDMVTVSPDDTTGANAVSNCSAAGSTFAPTACGLYSPAQIRFDPAGSNLYVADTFNNRALKYSSTTLAMSCTSNCHLPASQVWCQPDFNSSTAPEPPTASSCNLPTGIAADGSGNVFVADTVNNRVLGFPAGGNGQPASVVYGHAGSFVSPTPNDNGAGAAGSPTATNLNNPEGVALGPSGRLWIADFGNNRVLQFAQPTFPGTGPSETAIAELGQPGTANFTENGYNNQGPSASSLANPSGVTFDLAGNGFIADFGNDRLTEYTLLVSPTATRIARFIATRDGSAMRFSWRLTETNGILGFDLYAGQHQLNPRLIRATSRREYHYRIRGLKRGPFTLRLVLANGRQVAIAAATQDEPAVSSSVRRKISIAS